MTARLLIISPVRNEREHIDEVARAVAAQTCPPARWIVVDDGSTDGTAERLGVLATEIPFLRVVRTPPAFTLDDGDRLAAAGPDRAFGFGLSHARLSDFTHVAKLDGDIVLPPDYLEQMLARFAADPSLGMAGGALLERGRDGEWRVLPTPPEQVTAPARVYTSGCYEAIGGMPPRLGADVITTTYARMLGYRTATFADLPVRHLRPIGTADGALRGRARHGAYQYIVHYPLGWVALRALLVAVRFPPFGLSGLWYLAGYLRAALGPTQRVDDPAFRGFVRAELRARMSAALRRYAPNAARA